MAIISCPDCGKDVSDKAPACIHCGYPFQSAQDATPIAQADLAYTEPLPTAAPERKNIPIAAILIVTALVLGLGFLIFQSIQAPKAETRALLLKDWHTYIDGSTDSVWLDFEENGIVKYDFDSIYLGRKSIATYTYELLSATELKIDGSIHKIRFNDNKTMLIFDPEFLGNQYWH